MSNVDTVREIYAAFGRADIPAILDCLADDISWEHWDTEHSAQEAGVPYLRRRNGPGEVAAFFESLEALEFHAFEPVAFLEGNGQVVAVIKVDLTARETGRRFQDVEIHLWTFGPDGKVTGLRHFLDTAKHIDAFQA